jgi:hypothetical protein
MALANLRPGEWYLTATCQTCSCKIVLFPDMNNGRVEVKAVCGVTCPRCQAEASLQIEHYRHDRTISDSGASALNHRNRVWFDCCPQRKENRRTTNVARSPKTKGITYLGP